MKRGELVAEFGRHLAQWAEVDPVGAPERRQRVCAGLGWTEAEYAKIVAPGAAVHAGGPVVVASEEAGAASAQLCQPQRPAEIGTPRTPGQPPVNDAWAQAARPTLTNFEWWEQGEGEEKKRRLRALPLWQVREQLLKILNGCLYRLRGPGAREPILFLPVSGGGVRYVTSSPALAALAKEYAEVKFQNSKQDHAGVNWVTWAELYQDLGSTANVPEYTNIESFPHEPPMPGSFYAWLKPKEGGDMSALANVIGLFDNIKTPECRALFAAALVTPYWGGAAGKRPVFVFTADLPGSGKSEAVGFVGAGCGGLLDFRCEQRSEEERLKTRLLSPEGMGIRVLVLDNQKGKLDSSLIESLVTSPVISGHRLNHGEARRNNNLVVCVTVNDAVVTPDMARRAFFIRMERPETSCVWEERAAHCRESAHRLAVDALTLLRGPAPNVDLSGLSDYFPLWIEQVLARVLADVVIREVVGAVDLREVVTANLALRRKADVELNNAELLQQGLIEKILLREKVIERQQDAGGRDVTRVLSRPSGVLRMTSHELMTWWKEITGRKEINAQWAGTKFTQHILAGRVRGWKGGHSRQGSYYDLDTAEVGPYLAELETAQQRALQVLPVTA